MNEETLKAAYINLFLLACADGKIDPSERAYLKRFAKAANVGEENEKRWMQEVYDGNTNFRPINDINSAKVALKTMAHMLQVDGDFDPKEQELYIAMGKALGFDNDQLGKTLREFWTKDPLDSASSAPASPAPSSAVPAVLIIQDDLKDKTQVQTSAGSLPLNFITLQALAQNQTKPSIIIFHAAEHRNDSKERLAIIKRSFETAFIAFIARKDQAPQIGFLLEHGADRCFVEPLFPLEIEKAVFEIKK